MGTQGLRQPASPFAGGGSVAAGKEGSAGMFSLIIFVNSACFLSKLLAICFVFLPSVTLFVSQLVKLVLLDSLPRKELASVGQHLHQRITYSMQGRSSKIRLVVNNNNRQMRLPRRRVWALTQ